MVLRSARDLAGVADAPARLLEQPPVLTVAFGKMQGQLEWLRRQAWQLGELEKGDALVVVDADLSAILAELHPFSRPPPRHCRERLAPRVVCVGPQLEANRWANVPPRETAIREGCRRRADRLADREVHVVRENADLAGAHPDLCEAWIDIDEGRAAHLPEDARVDAVVAVEQQI